MKKIVSILLIIFISLFSYLNSPLNTEDTSTSSPSETTYLVTRVIDGDTIEINYNSETEKIRMIGIDTPETVKPNTPVQPFGKDASDFTKSMLLNNYISLEFDESERDKYNRLLAYVYIDGKMFNKILLEEGLACVYTFPPNVKYVKDFIAIESKAKSNKIGIWENYSNDTVLEVDATYIANSSSKKIHLLSCSYAKNISIYNKMFFDNLEYPLSKGYSKCESCFSE